MRRDKDKPKFLPNTLTPQFPNSFSFAAARRALRHRVEDHQHEVIKTRETEFTDSHLGALFDETVRLSGVSGPPTMNTPFDKMKEVTVYNKKVKSGVIDEKGGLTHDVIVATRRGAFRQPNPKSYPHTHKSHLPPHRPSQPKAG